MLEIRDWEKTCVQTKANVQGPHTNALFASSLSLPKEWQWWKKVGGRQDQGRQMDSVLIASGLCLKLSIKSKGFPAKCLPVECRASERNLKVQLGVNIAWAVVWLPAGGPPRAVPFCRAAICCSFNEWISLSLFWQNNSFCDVTCIPMDGLSPLLALLCVCVCVVYCRGWGGVKTERWCVSAFSPVGDGGCCEKVTALGWFLIGMLHHLFLWRTGQLDCCCWYLSMSFLQFVFLPSWTLKGWLRQQRICLQCRRPWFFDPWVGKISWKRKWQAIPVFLPGELHGQRSLASYSPWCRKELDTTWVTNTLDTLWKHWRMESLLSRSASEVQVYGIKYLSRFFPLFSNHLTLTWID